MSKKIENNENSHIITKNSDILELYVFFKELYLNNKKSINLSKNTIYNINSTLDRFYDYIADEMNENKKLSVININKYFLSSYLNFLSSTEISKNTQKLHLTIIKNFLFFIADYDIKEFGSIKSQINGLTVKTEQKEKPSISENEQNQIKFYLARLDEENKFLSHRNALLIKLLLYTGARISEILEIKRTDLSEIDDPEHGLVYTILLKGKGNKERYTYLLYSEIQSNVEFLNNNAKNHEYLISTTHGNRCNRSMIWLVIKQLLIKAGVAKSGLHIFRHTCARNLVRNNVNLSTIKELLGHSNITITAQFYSKSDEKAKKTALVQNIKQ